VAARSEHQSDSWRAATLQCRAGSPSWQGLPNFSGHQRDAGALSRPSRSNPWTGITRHSLTHATAACVSLSLAAEAHHGVLQRSDRRDLTVYRGCARVEPPVRRDPGRAELVDAVGMHDWEADLANRFGAQLLFWCWYLPAELISGARPTCGPSPSDSQVPGAAMSAAADRTALPPAKSPVRIG